VVEQRLRRVWLDQRERLHALELDGADGLVRLDRHQSPRHDDVRLRSGEHLKLVLKIAAGILLALAILFALAALVQVLRG
jgi:hypothetical protein